MNDFNDPDARFQRELLGRIETARAPYGQHSFVVTHDELNEALEPKGENHWDAIRFGRRKAGSLALALIAKTLGVSVHWLLHGFEEVPAAGQMYASGAHKKASEGPELNPLTGLPLGSKASASPLKFGAPGAIAGEAIGLHIR